MEEVENPKSEARSTKQDPMPQIQMTKTLSPWLSLWNIGHLYFEFVSDFVLRISSLMDSCDEEKANGC
jgi:hypothetical protein